VFQLNWLTSHISFDKPVGNHQSLLFICLPIRLGNAFSSP
jgi:hypothetical protein